MPTKEETRAKLRKFIEACVKQDLEATGEHAIEAWEGHIEDESGGIQNIYRFTAADREEIKAIVAEYRQMRDQEKNEGEDHADEALANYYVDRIRKIVLSKPNKFFPKPKSKSTTVRRRTH